MVTHIDSVRPVRVCESCQLEWDPEGAAQLQHERKMLELKSKPSKRASVFGSFLSKDSSFNDAPTKSSKRQSVPRAICSYSHYDYYDSHVLFIGLEISGLGLCGGGDDSCVSDGGLGVRG